jgi:hypothetical protein
MGEKIDMPQEIRSLLYLLHLMPVVISRIRLHEHVLRQGWFGQSLCSALTGIAVIGKVRDPMMRAYLADQSLRMKTRVSSALASALVPCHYSKMMDIHPIP